MEFIKILTMAGPNLWARFPVLEAWVELGDLKDSPSNEMPGFNDRLMGWLPTMIEHRCSIGERGGFFERLRRGTYLAHILEHVTLELQALAGADFGFGRARETSKEGLFRVAVRYEDEALGRACLEQGRQLCLAAVHDRPFDVDAAVRALRTIVDDVGLGPSTRTLVEAALARGVPVTRLHTETLMPRASAGAPVATGPRLESDSLVQFGYGARQRRMWTAETDRTGAIAEDISRDKELTRALLRRAGVPVAEGRPVSNAEEAWRAAREIGTPVVVKPQFGNQGDGVVIGVTTREQIESALRFAAPFDKGFMVEQLIHGAEHRLLVVGGKLVAATRGNPAVVVGDGRQTVRELIDSQLNSDPRRGTQLSCPLSPIEPKPSVQVTLEQQGYTFDSVPSKGTTVTVQRNGNLAIDVTDQVHPSVSRHVELSARIVGLDVAGIDVIADDIGRPLEEQGGVVIEVNAGPGLIMHVQPESGKPRPVGQAIIATLFPDSHNGRIPIVSVAGDETTTDVATLVAHLLSHAGRSVGLACAAGTFVAGTHTHIGDCRGAQAARGVLMNPLVEAAVLETSLEAAVLEGLAFDQCQVAVITAIGEGMKLDFAEWDTPEKRSLAYRITTDMVLPEGALVMKAGEPLGSILVKHCPGKPVLFSVDSKDAALVEHRGAGGKAVFISGGQIVAVDDGKQTNLGAAPSTLPVETVLPAVAAAWALGLGAAEISTALVDVPSELAKA